MTSWETVIGLEVHCELATRTKLFCGCLNDFGAEPNTYVCPVCLGLPGSLPVLNERAVEFALRVGEALHCEVPEESIFHRKNYFYPDMPKNYQVSQYDEPICGNGWLMVGDRRVGVERAHLEEDAGKTSHMGGGGGGRVHGADHSLVDYNRAGVPLLEIVSKPDLRSPEEARAYVTELRGVLEAIGVSDVKMEEGSLRIDANISLRPAGTEKLGTRAEIKNMNSLRSLARALEYEAERQAEVLEAGGTVIQETRHWDEAAGRTHPLRSKEESHDYRYFPEPDLVPMAPSEEWRERVRSSMPELPSARKARLQEAWGISDVDADVLVGTAGLADYAESVVAAGAPGRAGPVARRSGRTGETRRRRDAVAAPGQGGAGGGPGRRVRRFAGGRRGRAGSGPGERRGRLARRGAGRARRAPRRGRALPGRGGQGPEEAPGVLHGQGHGRDERPRQPPGPEPPARRSPRRDLSGRRR
jgi:aspartyl-tRNA(Asn)/glutamyl-tRNA(Gln) amidotransferase subunit B